MKADPRQAIQLRVVLSACYANTPISLWYIKQIQKRLTAGMLDGSPLSCGWKHNLQKFCKASRFESIVEEEKGPHWGGLVSFNSRGSRCQGCDFWW